MGGAEKATEPAVSDALANILRAAEVEFAEKGFEGAGMKALALRAGVSQSLLHYHFGSKDNLYAAVICERSRLINEDRLIRLRVIDPKSQGALALIFEALFVPALGPLGGGRAYARIFAGLIAGNARDQALVREFYDPTAQEFIRAIVVAMPGLAPTDAARIYQFALGVLASVIARDGRAERLAGNNAPKPDDTHLVRQLTDFAVGGAEAIAKTTKNQGRIE